MRFWVLIFVLTQFGCTSDLTLTPTSLEWKTTVGRAHIEGDRQESDGLSPEAAQVLSTEDRKE